MMPWFKKMEDEEIEHTEWTIFRDDGWDTLLDADNDIGTLREALKNLHPDIKWDVRTSSANQNHALEHLDLTIYIIEGKLETSKSFPFSFLGNLVTQILSSKVLSSLHESG